MTKLYHIFITATVVDWMDVSPTRPRLSSLSDVRLQRVPT